MKIGPNCAILLGFKRSWACVTGIWSTLQKKLERKLESRAELSSESETVPMQGELESSDDIEFYDAIRDFEDSCSSEYKRNLAFYATKGLTMS